MKKATALLIIYLAFGAWLPTRAQTNASDNTVPQSSGSSNTKEATKIYLNVNSLVRGWSIGTGLACVLALGGVAWWMERRNNRKANQCKTEIAAKLDALAPVVEAVQNLRQEAETQATQLRAQFGNPKEMFDKLVTKKELQNWRTEIASGSQSSASVLSESDRQNLNKLGQLASSLANANTSLDNIKTRTNDLNMRLSTVDATRKEMAETAGNFQKSVASALDQLRTVQTEVDKGVKDLSNAARSLTGQLAEKSEGLQKVATSAADLQSAASAFRENVNHVLEESKRVRAESETLQRKREEANAACMAHEAAIAKENELREANSALTQKIAEHRAHAEASQKMAEEERKAADTSRNDAAIQLQMAAEERVSAQGLHKEAANQKAEAERLNTETTQKQAETEAAVAQQNALQQKNQELLIAAQSEHTASEMLKQAAVKERAAADAAFADSKAERTAVTEQHLATQKLIQSFWPEVFCDQGPLADSRKEIEGWIAQQNTEAENLLSALYRFRAVANASNRQEMYDALRDVSRYAYRCWKSANISPDECAARAHQWAHSFGSRAGATFILKVAKPGMAKDNNWMSFKPASGAQVADAFTWAVYDEGNTVKRMAEVV